MPFVMHAKAEVRQAVEDFQAGKLGHIPALHDHGNVDATDSCAASPLHHPAGSRHGSTT